MIDCRPFSVSPESGFLAQGANMQVTLEYQSLVVGNHSTDLILHYETGQRLSYTVLLHFRYKQNDGSDFYKVALSCSKLYFCVDISTSLRVGSLTK